MVVVVVWGGVNGFHLSAHNSPGSLHGGPRRQTALRMPTCTVILEKTAYFCQEITCISGNDGLETLICSISTVRSLLRGR